MSGLIRVLRQSEFSARVVKHVGVHKWVQLKSKLKNTREPDRQQQERRAASVIAQQYSSYTFVSLRVHTHTKKNSGRLSKLFFQQFALLFQNCRNLKQPNFFLNSLLTSMFHYKIAILHAKIFLLQSLISLTNTVCIFHLSEPSFILKFLFTNYPVCNFTTYKNILYKLTFPKN
jgi:hypothetical protein